jgi:hypothetical protein
MFHVQHLKKCGTLHWNRSVNKQESLNTSSAEYCTRIVSTDNCNWFNLLLLRNIEQHTAYIIIIHCTQKSCKTTYKYILISNKNLITTKLVVSKNKNLTKYCSHTLWHTDFNYVIILLVQLYPKFWYFEARGLFSSKAMVYKILYKEVNMYDHLCQIWLTFQPGIWYLKHYYNGT